MSGSGKQRQSVGAAGASDERDERTPWILPGEPVAVRLMNTIYADREGAHDALAAPADLASWLVATGLLDRCERVTRDELDQARRLRDALRRIGGAVTGDACRSATRDVDEALAVVNAVAAAAANPPRARLVAGRLRREPGCVGPPVACALSAVAASAIVLLTDAGAPQLRACDAPGCVLFFVRDHPRRAWCSAACGNRARVARHYRRHRGAAAGGAPGDSG